MIREIVLASSADFAGWRQQARALLTGGVRPGEVLWRVAGEDRCGDLLAAGASAPKRRAILGPSDQAAARQPTPRVPRSFLELGEDAVCHRADLRFDLLYRLLWRLQQEPELMQVTADADIHQLLGLAKAVRRDKHKMTAFVRFREMQSEDGPHYVAWFEPGHHILAAVAPFFVRRFASMQWSILTPDGSLHWNGKETIFGPAATRSDGPAGDRLEEHWRTYYASIFNPARLNTRAMKREMPMRYWRNMPETELIPELVHGAVRRTQHMIEASAAMEPLPTPAAYGDAAATTDARFGSRGELATELAQCRRCELWRCASRVVPGEGPADAPIVFVGEQPGDQEDRAGRPFVGPAGQVLDEALAAAGLPRRALYLTNAVKHFKFLLRGKRRLHRTPDRSEIAQCRRWLQSELALIRPKLIVALGATAAASLLGHPVKIAQTRGRWLPYEDGAQLLVTVHPSYLLRLQEPLAADEEKRRFLADMAMVRKQAEALSLAPFGRARPALNAEASLS